ncbi:MAG: ubiquitin carboxyl-terminal hydrolase [Myxococcales bacterium]|nr:ubiquitin carboxyl-terminal hydrolase [Myxococcales bacterium]USN50654.1 MAG: ubiquitin carboxyl-terminal hydrolase [Myxococcales bacterium]
MTSLFKLLLVTSLFHMSCSDGARTVNDRNPEKQTQSSQNNIHDKKLSSLEKKKINHNKLPQEEVSLTPLPTCGLRNLGNTCFANASLNLLFSSSTFQKTLKSELVKEEREPGDQFAARKQLQEAARALNKARQEKKEALHDELSEFFDVYERTRKLIKGSELVGSVDKVRRDQADTNEFITDIFDFLPIEPLLTFAYNEFIDKSVKFFSTQPLQKLELPLSGKPDNIQSLINKMFLPAPMVGNNQVENSKGVQMDSIRYEAIEDPLPRSLFISLKRFAYDGAVKKLFDRIIPDKNIEIKTKNRKDIKQVSTQQYTLKGIAVHSGATMHSGHYYAYIYDGTKNTWILFNDSSVSSVDEKAVFSDATENAYVYLYEKKQ